MRLLDKGVIGSTHRDESLEALEKDVLFLAPMSSSSRRLMSRRGCMSMSRRNACTGRSSSSSIVSWRRRKMGSPDKLWLIRSMVSIILKLHFRLGVDDLLDIRCIDHIGGSMLYHVKHPCPEEHTDAGRRTVIQNSKQQNSSRAIDVEPITPLWHQSAAKNLVEDDILLAENCG
jgi:hypothetical protein